MTQWHRISSVGPPLKVESLEFCDRPLDGLRFLNSGTCHTFKPLKLLNKGRYWFASFFIDLDILLHLIPLMQLSD